MLLKISNGKALIKTKSSIRFENIVDRRRKDTFVHNNALRRTPFRSKGGTMRKRHSGSRRHCARTLL